MIAPGCACASATDSEYSRSGVMTNTSERTQSQTLLFSQNQRWLARLNISPMESMGCGSSKSQMQGFRQVQGLAAGALGNLFAATESVGDD